MIERQKARKAELAVIISFPTSASAMIVFLKKKQNIDKSSQLYYVTMYKNTPRLTRLHARAGYNGS